MTSHGRPVWLITGASRGFGRAMVREALGRGFTVVAGMRSPDASRAADAGADGLLVPLRLDVTDPSEIEACVGSTLRRFGRIDVLVNNAGHGYLSAIEEGGDADVRTLFDVNFFGLAAMTRAALPVMRAQRRGLVVNISSAAGFNGLPGSGYYAASKFAVEGLSEALAAEVRPLGIDVLVVEPGPFRTDWAGSSLQETTSDIPDYTETAGARRSNIRRMSGTQVGDPDRAARIIVDAALDPDRPFRLPLGRAAAAALDAKLARVAKDVAPWRQRGLAADFPVLEEAVA